MERNVYIYGLIDPITNQIRYVGKSLNPKSRLRRHIADRNLYDSYKDRWIRKLKENNIRPELIIIDEVLEKEWQFWESYYISYFKFIGCNLTNGTNGGDQPPSTKGRKHREESKKKMSQSKKGKPIPWLNNNKKRTEKHRKNLSKSLKGRVSPNRGKTFSDEYKKKLSDSHMGQTSGFKGKNHSEETKKKIKEKRKLQVFSKESIDKRSKSIQKKVLQYCDGVLIKKWESVKETTDFLNISYNTLNKSIKNNTPLKGYIWKMEKK